MRTLVKITTIVFLFQAEIEAQVKIQNLPSTPKTGTFVPRTVQLAGSSNNSNSYLVNTNITSLSSNSESNYTWAYTNTWAPNYSNYGNVNYYYQQPIYNNYSLSYRRKMARQRIREANYIIREAVNFNQWHAVYSPVLAKAVRHLNYANASYRWGNYDACYNHAERAKYLAWFSLQYFEGPNYTNYNNSYPNPYSDPNNPYYKSDLSNTHQSSELNHENIKLFESELDSLLPSNNLDDKKIIENFSCDNFDE